MNKKNSEKYNIIIAHPGKQHSYRLAEALEKSGNLLYYATTVYNSEKSFTKLVGRFLRGDNKKRFLTRKDEIFDHKVIQFCEIRGLLLLFLLRICPESKVTSCLEHNVHRNMYRKVIRFAKNRKVDAIIFFGGVEKCHFEMKKRLCPNTKIIIDVPIATKEYIQKIFENDIIVTKNEYIRHEQKSTWKFDSKECVSVRYKMADGFLAGSNFVKNSLVALGADLEKIKIVPYGVDLSRFTLKTYEEKKDKVKFIFVGRIDRRKGIQHLLPAFKRLNSEKAELVLVGNYDKKDPLVQEYMKVSNIKFVGFVTQDIVVDLYKKSDVFVLPSLGEGLAQVSIEAMSCGLPIIVSENTGVNDLIENGKEGFVIPVSDTNKIYNAMLWFVENKDQIKKMGQDACHLAEKYTWDYYGQNVSKAVSELINNDKGK